jgi:hypothetical protein
MSEQFGYLQREESEFRLGCERIDLSICHVAKKLNSYDTCLVMKLANDWDEKVVTCSDCNMLCAASFAAFLARSCWEVMNEFLASSTPTVCV